MQTILIVVAIAIGLWGIIQGQKNAKLVKSQIRAELSVLQHKANELVATLSTATYQVREVADAVQVAGGIVSDLKDLIEKAQEAKTVLSEAVSKINEIIPGIAQISQAGELIEKMSTVSATLRLIENRSRLMSGIEIVLKGGSEMKTVSIAPDKEVILKAALKALEKHWHSNQPQTVGYLTMKDAGIDGFVTGSAFVEMMNAMSRPIANDDLDGAKALLTVIVESL